MDRIKATYDYLLSMGYLNIFYPKATGVWERDKEMMEEEERKTQEYTKKFLEENKDFFGKWSFPPSGVMAGTFDGKGGH